jgi:hypothetical protein
MRFMISDFIMDEALQIGAIFVNWIDCPINHV